MNKKLRENSFDAAPGGMNGTVNYAPTYGTFASPDVSQNPNQFYNSNNNKALGPNSNNTTTGPDSGSIQKDLNAIYSKKETPSPDEIITGIHYEESRMSKRNRQLAKELVVKNLRNDPKFYSSLHHMNISDQDMVNNMEENKKTAPIKESMGHPNDVKARLKITPNVEETKKIFADMEKASEKKYVVNSQICDVMKELWAAKKARGFFG